MMGVLQLMSPFLGWGMGWMNRIQVVVLRLVRIARVMWVMYQLMVLLVVPLLRVVEVTHRVSAALVMPTVRVLPLMPLVLVPLVMHWWMVSLVTVALMVRVLQGMLRVTVPLMMTTVRVLQEMVLGVSPRLVGCRLLLAPPLATPGGGPGWRWWSVGSPVLAVLVASGVGAGPGKSWRRVLMVRVV